MMYVTTLLFSDENTPFALSPFLSSSQPHRNTHADYISATYYPEDLLVNPNACLVNAHGVISAVRHGQVKRSEDSKSARRKYNRDKKQLFCHHCFSMKEITLKKTYSR